MTVFFVALILLTALMNGLTDAPNSVSSCVFTRSMTPSSAFIMASLCNFAGGLLTTLFAPRVARTVYSMVSIQNGDRVALVALCAGILAVIIWSAITFFLGMSAGYTHALMAGISGASFAVRSGADTVNIEYWLIIAVGFAVSTFSAFFISRAIYTCLLKFCSGLDRQKALRYFMRTRRRAGAYSAFMHGAQDTQKIIGIFMLGLSLMANESIKADFNIPIRAALAIALFMSIGILIGGSRTVKKAGLSMTSLDAIGATASDLSSSVILFVCTALGVPISTVQSKICAIMGAGSRTPRGVDKRVSCKFILIWIATIPICAVLGFLFALFFV